MIYRKNAGFTLIELLVTITIISILTVLLTVNFVGTRARGRDGQRKSHIFQIQSAFEIYRSDNGSYPATLPSCDSPLTAGTAQYMKKMPCDPLGGAYIYTKEPVGCDNISTICSSYTLKACLENGQDSQKDSTKASECSSQNASFTVSNP